MDTDPRPTFSTATFLALFAGIGLIAITAAAVAVLAVRPPPPDIARTEPTLPAKPPPHRDKSAPPAANPAPTKPAAVPLAPPPRPVPATPAPEPPRHARLEPEPAPVVSRYKLGSAIEQEVIVTRRSTYRVQDIEVTQAAEYTITSDLEVTAVRPDGGCVMTQTVRATRLGECDPTLRQDMDAALRKTQGTTFEIAVTADGEVRAFKGADESIHVQVPNDPGRTMTFRVWSILDADGWKELAGLTLLQPAKNRANWDRPIAHDWGPLGGWSGKTTFRVNGKYDGRDRIDFAHSLTYRKPNPGAGDDLPLKIVRSEFRTPTAGGSILYDPKAGRVARAEETFQARGRVTVAAIPGHAAVDLDERQDFRLTVREPRERALAGVPNR